jgi:hypothetical protein
MIQKMGETPDTTKNHNIHHITEIIIQTKTMIVAIVSMITAARIVTKVTTVKPKRPKRYRNRRKIKKQKMGKGLWGIKRDKLSL